MKLYKILTNSCIKLWYSLYISISAFFFLFSVIKVFLRRANWFSWSSNFFIFFCKSSYCTLTVPELCNYMNINQHNNLRIIIITTRISLVLKTKKIVYNSSKLFFHTLELSCSGTLLWESIYCHSINIMLIYNVSVRWVHFHRLCKCGKNISHFSKITLHPLSLTKKLRNILTQTTPQLQKWSSLLSSSQKFQHSLGK